MNNIKIDEKSNKIIFIYYVRYGAIKDSKYVKFNSVNPLYLIFNKVNGYFEEIDGSKYSTLVPTNESKGKIKKYEELWSKIKDLIRSITKNPDDYYEKYMKIKFNSDDELPLNKRIEIPSMIIVIKAFFYENNKYYPQFFLDECPFKIQSIKMESKDELKEIDIKNRTCYFFDHIIKDVDIYSSDIFSVLGLIKQMDLLWFVVMNLDI